MWTYAKRDKKIIMFSNQHKFLLYTNWDRKIIQSSAASTNFFYPLCFWHNTIKKSNYKLYNPFHVSQKKARLWILFLFLFFGGTVLITLRKCFVSGSALSFVLIISCMYKMYLKQYNIKTELCSINFQNSFNNTFF